jgi:hypothetical protein
VTCTLLFAIALLRQQRVPILRELIVIDSPGRFIPAYGPFSYQWEEFGFLLVETSRTRAPMRTLSIPDWMPWPRLFDIAQLLSEGNQSGIIPTLVLPSLPHPHILDPLVRSLNGELVTEMPDLPSCQSESYCHAKGVCFECHNGGWACVDAKKCRRGRRGEPAAITRYTLLNK